MSHCEICHKPFIPDIAGFQPTTLSIGDEETFIVHQHCCDEVLRNCKALHGKKYEEYIKKLLRGLSMILCLVLSLALCGEVNPQEEWVKGGVVVGISLQGGCVFKPFVNVGWIDHPDDEGEPEYILGFEPGNVQISRKGDVIWERVPEKSFVPLGRVRSVQGRICKCPPYNM